MDVLNTIFNEDTQTLGLREAPKPARLIRYTTIATPAQPDLLSVYDEDRNILYIDFKLADNLPELDKQRLEMTYFKRTKLSNSYSTLGFVDYDAVPVTYEVTDK